jgi:drug/metabolite transporter (DMT)-like permease
MGDASPTLGRTALLTGLALLAFAANSVLARLALGGGAMDAASYTAVRVLAGAFLLLLVLGLSGQKGLVSGAWSWPSASLLFTYAIAFSVAYLDLSIGTGALLLFGAVQLTMLAAALRAGERPSSRTWLGLAAAVTGLLLLVAPGLAAPEPVPAALMALAGVAWGLFTLRGRRSGRPLAEMAASFTLAVPLALGTGLLAAAAGPLVVTPRGLALALASGALASGLGYVAWYAALPGLSVVRAAVLQLGVPVLAAGLGLLLGEAITPRLVLASMLVLGGIALTLSARQGAAPE